MATSKKSASARVLEALASLKLTIFLFFALAATSMFGTVIQQQADPHTYIESYGRTLSRIFEVLNLVDMYHSWWFEVLLALLLLNTLVCSLRRLPAAVRSIRRDQYATAQDLATKPLRASWTVGDGAEAAVEATLRETLGPPRAAREEGATSWFLQKQPWARLGAYVAHASLVLFFLGGIIGARYGFKGFVNIMEGQSVTSVQLRDGGTLALPFEVACESFELHTYPDGRPKDYLSRLEVRRGEELIKKKTIEVNDPLIQDGIYFYQSSYGKAGGGAVLKAVSAEGRPILAPVKVPQEGTVRVPGTDLSVEVVGTAENYDGFGPAAQLVLVAQGPNGHAHVGEPFVVLQNFPDFDRRRGGEQVFQLANLLPGQWYTGLQVAKDPGVPLIWAGSLLLTVGTLMAFFASHRRIWVLLEGGRLTLAGAAAKNQHTFRETFAELEKTLREKTEVTSRARRAAG